MSKKIKCMIVDDEPLAIQLLTAHLKQIDQLELVATAINPIEAISLIKAHDIDLLFLDIQMPVLTGIELVKALQNRPDVIFTTAYRDYAVESYELDVVDYLMKPITFVRFVQSVNKYLDKTAESISPTNKSIAQHDSVESIYVNVNRRYVKVIFDEIKYIESVKDYIHIHTVSDTIITKETITNFETKVPINFLRIHRSFIVNRSKITAFTSHDVEIGTKEIPIGGSYRDEVMSTLK